MMLPRNAGRCRRHAGTKLPSETPLDVPTARCLRLRISPLQRQIHCQTAKFIASIYMEFLYRRPRSSLAFKPGSMANDQRATREALAYFVDINLRFIKDLGDPRC
jgi:hypothetical protein